MIFNCSIRKICLSYYLFKLNILYNFFFILITGNHNSEIALLILPLLINTSKKVKRKVQQQENNVPVEISEFLTKQQRVDSLVLLVPVRYNFIPFF